MPYVRSTHVCVDLVSSSFSSAAFSSFHQSPVSGTDDDEGDDEKSHAPHRTPDPTRLNSPAFGSRACMSVSSIPGRDERVNRGETRLDDTRCLFLHMRTQRRQDRADQISVEAEESSREDPGLCMRPTQPDPIYENSGTEKAGRDDRGLMIARKSGILEPE